MILRQWHLLAAAAGLVLLLGVMLKGRFPLAIIGTGLGTIGLILLAAAAGCQFIAGQQNSETLKDTAFFIGIGSTLSLLTGIALMLGVLVSLHEIESARDYCDRLMPQLDSVRRIGAEYPPSLEHLRLSEDDLPAALLANANCALLDATMKKDRFYLSNGTTFLFCFEDPGNSHIGHIWNSTDRTWKKSPLK